MRMRRSATCARRESTATYGSDGCTRAGSCSELAATRRRRRCRARGARDSLQHLQLMRERRGRLDDDARVFLRGPQARRRDRAPLAPRPRAPAPARRAAASTGRAAVAARRMPISAWRAVRARRSRRGIGHPSPSTMATTRSRPPTSCAACASVTIEVRRRQQFRHALRPFDEARAVAAKQSARPAVSHSLWICEPIKIKVIQV